MKIYRVFLDIREENVCFLYLSWGFFFFFFITILCLENFIFYNMYLLEKSRLIKSNSYGFSRNWSYFLSQFSLIHIFFLIRSIHIYQVCNPTLRHLCPLSFQISEYIIFNENRQSNWQHLLKTVSAIYTIYKFIVSSMFFVLIIIKKKSKYRVYKIIYWNRCSFDLIGMLNMFRLIHCFNL